MATPEEPRILHALFYDYVPDVAARRAPHRPAHLALVERLKAEGRVLMGGALGDPPSGALIVFDAAPAEVEAFVADDPYVAAGLVTAHRVVRWTVVA